MDKIKLSIIAEDYESGTITEHQARTLLLDLLGVSGSLPNSCPQCGCNKITRQLFLNKKTNKWEPSDQYTCNNDDCRFRWYHCTN